ncbi:MAG: Sec-independent protein translocase protein TatB [Burkholderiales bacterium]|nr:Sec-independent protein translocase protein TatB [Burkholderiales bacterium]
MFDISFSELLLIGIVALVVIGPERLPRVARTVGLLVGRAQRYVHDVKVEIQREANLEEIQKMQEEARESAMKLEASLKTRAFEYEKKFREAENTLHGEFENVNKPPEEQEDPRQLRIDFGEK